MIEFLCYSCSQKIGVDDGLAGRRVKCPVCGTHHTVPANKVRWIEEEPSKNPLSDRTLLIETVSDLESPAAGQEPIQPPPMPVAYEQRSSGLSSRQLVALFVACTLVSIGVIAGILMFAM